MASFFPWICRAFWKKREGKLIQLEEAGPVEQALALRALAAEYDQVVLHVHMQDIIPLLAFGRKDFPRPVIFYNHADHLFWLGVSIADLVVNFRQLSVILSEEARGAKVNAWLPLPISCPATEDTDALRKNLNIPKDAKIILSVGSPYKFRPINEMNFLAMAQQLLEKHVEAYFLFIGPSSNGCWKKAQKVGQGRIKPLGVIPSHQLVDYLALADLFIEPYPMGSFVATLDAAMLGVPCLALRNPSNELESYAMAGIYCSTADELLFRAGCISTR